MYNFPCYLKIIQHPVIFCTLNVSNSVLKLKAVFHSMNLINEISNYEYCLQIFIGGIEINDSNFC